MSDSRMIKYDRGRLCGRFTSMRKWIVVAMNLIGRVILVQLEVETK